MKASEINIRDPFILPDGGKYYLYGSRGYEAWGACTGLDVYVSEDLDEWSEPTAAFQRPADFWADKNFWAPEVHKYNGAYYITKVGYPVGNYYLLVQDGVFHDQQEIDSMPHFDTARPGDFKFIDADGDGVMERDEDRVIVGNYMPDFYYGFGFDLGYKGWNLAANFQGVYGNEILNLERRYLCNITASSNMMRESLQRWPYGEVNRATRKTTGESGACTSTFHLEDGSYLRLQNLSLGYTFPNKMLKKAKISNLRLFLQGSNLFTFTNYSGYNPEVNNHASDALRPGEDYCSYPLSRTFSIGLNFNM